MKTLLLIVLYTVGKRVDRVWSIATRLEGEWEG